MGYRRIFSNLIVIATIVLVGIGCGGSSSTSGGSPGNKENDSDTSTTVTLSGVVTVESSDLAPSQPAGLSKSSALQKSARVAFANSTVSLVKVQPDGTETTVATTTADSDGAYSFSGVPVAVGGTGASTDFYYEVRATNDTITVAAPTAPEGDTTVNVSPETNLAAKILSDVVDVPTADTNPTPLADTIEGIRTRVTKNVDDLESSITVPALSETDSIVDIANGIAAAGGDAEKMYKAAQFESEFVGLTNTDGATTEEMAGYIKRVMRESCDQNTTVTQVTIRGAQALAEAIEGEHTFTPTEVCNAFNEVNPDGPITCSSKVADYAEMLTALDQKIAGTDTDDITAAEQLGLYTKRNLKGSTFDTNTALQPDQALAFLTSLTTNESGECQGDTTPVIAALVEDLSLKTDFTSPSIEEVEIYHNSGFGCNEGAGQGHFVAKVCVYLPSNNVSVDFVTIASTDSDALDGDGEITLTGDPGGTCFTSNENGVCVEEGLDVTYTVTANLSDGSRLTSTVTRNHPRIPEAITTLNGSSLSDSSDSPTVTTDARPLLTWTPPATTLASISDAPTGSAVKYTYEYAHFLNGGSGPISPSADCPAVSSGALYAVDNLIPTVDCKVDTCAQAQGVSSDQISCRINIQTFLVDQYDNLLGQAAGNFRFLCVDTNRDGSCGGE